MINWPTVWLTVAIVMAIQLIEIVAEWYIDRRDKKRKHREAVRAGSRGESRSKAASSRRAIHSPEHVKSEGVPGRGEAPAGALLERRGKSGKSKDK